MWKIKLEGYSTYGGNYTKDTRYGICEVTLLGFIVEEDDEKIILKQGFNNIGQNINLQVIPKKCITEREDFSDLLTLREEFDNLKELIKNSDCN